MCETHISWVFLVGERAYKLKKRLVLSFLDYGTAERRREMCVEELRLNRRLAPDVYLGVRGVAPAPGGLALCDDSDPRAIDYVVEMRRYDEDRALSATLGRGGLSLSDVAEVARTLAEFHARCEPVRSCDHGAHLIEGEVDRNVEELLGVAEQRGELTRIRALAAFMTAFLTSRSRELDERAARGMIRECHGDLRAEHVVLEQPVCVVDCVEFDRGLRTLDVADDLAFLVMDLAARGGERFAAELVDAYRAAGGDRGDDSLLAFFAVHRALVRAKVLLVRAAQHPAGTATRDQANAQARDLLALAERFSWRARLPLVLVICGVPASGKSHLADALASASALPRISSDLVRKELAGIGSAQAASAEYYSPDFSHATYAELGRRATGMLAEHGGAVVDATFRHRSDRDAFAHACLVAAPVVFVECLAPADVLAERAVRRERSPGHVSDATLPVVMRERSTWEPLGEVPARSHIALRTDRPVGSVAADLIRLLDAVCD
jgi:uncharacterized protein